MESRPSLALFNEVFDYPNDFVGALGFRRVIDLPRDYFDILSIDVQCPCPYEMEFFFEPPAETPPIPSTPYMPPGKGGPPVVPPTTTPPWEDIPPWKDIPPTKTPPTRDTPKIKTPITRRPEPKEQEELPPIEELRTPDDRIVVTPPSPGETISPPSARTVTPRVSQRPPSAVAPTDTISQRPAVRPGTDTTPRPSAIAPTDTISQRPAVRPGTDTTPRPSAIAPTDTISQRPAVRPGTDTTPRPEPKPGEIVFDDRIMRPAPTDTVPSDLIRPATPSQRTDATQDATRPSAFPHLLPRDRDEASPISDFLRRPRSGPPTIMPDDSVPSDRVQRPSQQPSPISDFLRRPRSGPPTIMPPQVEDSRPENLTSPLSDRSVETDTSVDATMFTRDAQSLLTDLKDAVQKQQQQQQPADITTKPHTAPSDASVSRFTPPPRPTTTPSADLSKRPPASIRPTTRETADKTKPKPKADLAKAPQDTVPASSLSDRPQTGGGGLVFGSAIMASTRPHTHRGAGSAGGGSIYGAIGDSVLIPAKFIRKPPSPSEGP